MKKKILKITGVTFLILLLATFIYSRILQSQADENGKIFDDRCNNVNPALIAYKNSYLQMWQVMNNNGSKDEAMQDFNNYISGIQKYIPLENNWLDKDSKYINNWAFQIFQPKYIKDLATLQYNMYKAQRDDAEYIQNLFENPNSQNNTDPTIPAKNLQDASNKYFSAQDAASKKKDWRKLLWTEPPVNCDRKNLIIPNTSIDNIFATPVPEVKNPEQTG
ncbi:MAG TPA: hypothetical protein VG895_02845 [Patescibacteria group bacterium]|nr:hypothetical protein [Patescibacteria group bacterium]